MVLCVFLLFPAHAVCASPSDDNKPEPVIIVRADQSYPPYEFLDHGQPAGFNIELIRRVATVMDLKIRIEPGPWNQVREDLNQGRIHVLSGLFYSKERDRQVDFSIPYLMPSSGLFVREDSPVTSFADITGKEIIVQQADIMHDFILEKGVTPHIVTVSKPADALSLLASGRHDAALLSSRVQGFYFIDRMKLAHIRHVENDLPVLRYCFAVREGNDDLLYKLDEGLNALRITGEYQKIYEKWFAVYEHLDLKSPWQMVMVLAYAAVPVGLVVALVLLWSWSLRRQVRNKTGELYAELVERTRVEEALQQSEEQLRSTLTSMEELVFVLDKNGVFCGYEQPLDRPELYVPAENFLGKPYHEVMPPHVSRAFDQAIDAVRASGKVRQVDYFLEKEDHTAWFSANLSMRSDSEGRFAGVTVVSRDITKRKRAEEALKDSEERYRKLISTSPDGIVIITPAGEFLDANQAFQDMLGYSLEELRGMCHDQVMASERFWPATKLFSTVEQKGHLGPFELEFKKKDGSILPVELIGWVVQGSEGNPEKLGAFVRDISEQITANEERKRLQDQLQQAQKMEAIGTLAGGIAHDFNNILGVIIGYAEMVALFDIPEDSPSRSRLDEIIKAADRATELVRQILTFSRQTEHTVKPIKLGPLVKETLKFLRASLPTTIEIRSRVEGTGTVLADPTQMHQILMNLCANAGHAMGESGGVLEVTLGDVVLGVQEAGRHVDLTPGPYVRLEVRDTGHGMSRDIMERIFDPYFTTKKMGDGTGLGLSVVHGIVKTCGGAISVDSELGAGTTFQVFLPQFGAEAFESDAKPAPPMASGSERILFVDDEKPLVDIAGTMLDRLGYEAVGKDGGLEALAAFRAEPDRFDLVITDQTMPKMTGMELAREVMQIRPDTPVILCSGFSEIMTSDKARAAGIRAVIHKPLIAATLAETIRNVLDKGH